MYKLNSHPKSQNRKKWQYDFSPILAKIWYICKAENCCADLINKCINQTVRFSYECGHIKGRSLFKNGENKKHDTDQD